jgi:hypothetical protein
MSLCCNRLGDVVGHVILSINTRGAEHRSNALHQQFNLHVLFLQEILDYNISYHTQFLSEFGVYHKMTMRILIKIFG